MPDQEESKTDTWLKFVQVISVLVGVVISVLSFNDTRNKEAEAKKAVAKTEQLAFEKYNDQKKSEEYKNQVEAAQPFLELRQKRYLEAVHAAGVLATPDKHTKMELGQAEKTFWELFYADLSLVEEQKVAKAMENFADSLKSIRVQDRQDASLELAHILRDSLLRSWNVADTKAGNVPFKEFHK